MSDIIQLLPDAVANQIAAGEVIQRPASVVKELVENSIDAGSSSITVRVKNAGKTYVQVIDNGKGMSENDARLCFERHATSKISDANDLFSIRTMGFRGEALASMSAIAEVSLKTRSEGNDIGTHIRVSGSKIDSQEPVSTPVGTNISIKNIFFNVPARRKFLKSDQAELRHIITEFNHTALAYPDIEFILIHNNTEIYNLPASNRKKRIAGVIGKKTIQQNLIDIHTETSIVKIKGFIGKPENAKKTYGEQYLFVNNRFMKHPYFNKAIIKAYEGIIPAEHYPSYFIYFEINPSSIDINIHPTKTEIKFEDERSIWHILHASTKEAIGKHNLSPTLDFDREGVIDIPVLKKDQEIRMPKTNINHAYNPFEAEKAERGINHQRPKIDDDWQKLYNKKDNEDLMPGLGFENQENEQSQPESRYLQLKGKYILTPVKSGLMVIDQRRAHERILFENHLNTLQKNKSTQQKTLFPETIELNTEDYQLCLELIDEIDKLGFEIRDFGQNSVIVHSIPANTAVYDIKSVIESLLDQYKEFQSELKLDQHEKLARATAVASAIPYGKQLSNKEMQEMVDKLFACSNPNTTPGGRTILNIVKLDDFEKHLA